MQSGTMQHDVKKKKEKEKLSKDNMLHGLRRQKYITKSNKSLE